MELSKTFDAKSAEERWFQLWIDRGYFKADPAKGGKPFSIVIPPPNVTGQLHIGHALNVTLQDVIVRTRRMQGYNTLWLPGTDHAGIATQNVVERDLAKEGKTRHDLGREAFVERVWRWKETYGGRILNQLRRLGASCDWSRERFTLDPGLSRAVVKVFVMLYREGLIYRAHRLINWCPRCETALSDLEVDHKDVQGRLWYIKYPMTDGTGFVTVATTRPETMLGDTAVAVNPDDERYAGLVGKKLRLPLVNREIPLIADATVDREFGTGAVKITPAHDFNDFETGRRHNLAQIVVIDQRGKMTAEAGAYQGLTREEARKRIIEDLTAQDLLEKSEPHKLSLGVCSRCDTAVEPMLSDQWFVAVNQSGPNGESLAGAAIAAVENGATTFHPKFWENTYFSWMRNLQDWCISRQLWWGHRIPAWWCERCEKPEPIVAEERPSSCPACGGSDLRQDEDVLDTWFSSGLWPFSTLGWPDDTPELQFYYPTSLLVTGFDIIFFWVARMMMFGLKCVPRATPEESVPFRDVYITPLVRDQYGKKMTKSRGNVVDPLEIMDRYGTDAVRFTLAQMAIQGRDLILSDDRLAASRAFANKIWNAARFVMMNLDGAPQPLPQVANSQSLADRWILDRLNKAIGDVTKAIDAYEFNNAALIVYQFIWHEFCDWYIELSKEPLKAGGESQAAARYVLVTVFDQMLRILHPFMPFISEEIWQALKPYMPEQPDSEHLAVARFPIASYAPYLTEAEALAMQRCIETSNVINSLRALTEYHPGKRAIAWIRPVVWPEGPQYYSAGSIQKATQHFEKQFANWRPYVQAMAKAENLRVINERAKPPARTVSAIVDWGEIFLQIPEEFDFDKARQDLKKKLSEANKHLDQHERRLADPGFRKKARSETLRETEDKVIELRHQVGLLEIKLEALGEEAVG
jgi:valyl-tRNA synthetase